MLYHGTSSENYLLIAENGYNINLSEDQRWGKGIYFTDSIDTALAFGEKVLEIDIDNSLILELSYSEIADIFSDLSRFDEEGTPRLREYVLSNTDYKIVSIQYDDGEKEVVVYDFNLIN